MRALGADEVDEGLRYRRQAPATDIHHAPAALQRQFGHWQLAQQAVLQLKAHGMAWQQGDAQPCQGRFAL